MNTDAHNRPTRAQAKAHGLTRYFGKGTRTMREWLSRHNLTENTKTNVEESER